MHRMFFNIYHDLILIIYQKANSLFVPLISAFCIGVVIYSIHLLLGAFVLPMRSTACHDAQIISIDFIHHDIVQKNSV